MKSLKLFIAILLTASIGHTKGIEDLPSNILDLTGVFCGKVQNTKKDVCAIVSPIKERGQKSGRWNIFVYYEDLDKASLYEGEIVEGNRIGLILFGLDPQGSTIEAKPPTGGVMKMTSSQKSGRYVEISGISTSPLVLNKREGRVALSANIPAGLYRKGNDELAVNGYTRGVFSVTSRISSLGLRGDLIGSFEHDNVVALRAETFNSSMNTVIGDQVASAMMGFTVRGKGKILVVKLGNNQTLASAKVLAKK